MPGRKARPFSPAEEALLIDLKENQELAWSEIGVAFCRVFPKRTAGALQVHYCRKLHLRRDRRRRPQQDRSETNEHDDDEEEEDDGDGEDLNGTHSQTSSSTAGRVTRSALARAVKRQRIVEQDDDQSDPSDDSMLDASYFNSRISSDAKSSRRTLASSRPKSNLRDTPVTNAGRFDSSSDLEIPPILQINPSPADLEIFIAMSEIEKDIVTCLVKISMDLEDETAIEITGTEQHTEE